MASVRHVVVLLLLGVIGVPLHAAPAVDPASAPAPSLVATRADPAVARAVAEAAAELPVPAAATDASPAPDRAFADALASSKRRCTPLEAAAKVALVATCVRLSQCSPLPASAGAQPALPQCYLFKEKS